MAAVFAFKDNGHASRAYRRHMISILGNHWMKQWTAGCREIPAGDNKSPRIVDLATFIAILGLM